MHHKIDKMADCKTNTINDRTMCFKSKSSRQKIIDSKDSIANKFFSFFSAKSEEPKSLTDEEKESIDEYFKEENLIKYIKGELFSDEVENKSNNILNKYIKHLDSLDCNADLYCFEIINIIITIYKIELTNITTNDKVSNLSNNKLSRANPQLASGIK